MTDHFLPSTRNLLLRATQEDVEVEFSGPEAERRARNLRTTLLSIRRRVERQSRGMDPICDVEIFQRTGPPGVITLILSTGRCSLTEPGVTIRSGNMVFRGEDAVRGPDSAPNRRQPQDSPPAGPPEGSLFDDDDGA